MKKVFKIIAIFLVILNIATNVSGKVIHTISRNRIEIQEVDRLEKIKQKGVLTVISPNEEPYSYKDSVTGAFSGLDAEIIKEIAKRLGVKEVSARYVPFANSLGELVNNPNIDLFAQGIYITDERKEIVDFTNPIYSEKDAILTREDSDINSKDDLKNKIIGVEGGSVYVSMAEKWKEQGELKDYILLFNNESLQLALKNKMVDAILTDSIIAENSIAVNPKLNLKLLSPSQYKSEVDFSVGYPLKKGDTALKKAIDEIIEEMRNDGTLYEILLKYGLGEHYIQG